MSTDTSDLGGQPNAEQEVEEQDLTDCLVIPMEHLPGKGQVGLTTTPEGKRYAILDIESAEGLKADRAFLHVLRRNGVTSWSKYNKSLKDFRKEQYGDKH